MRRGCLLSTFMLVALLHASPASAAAFTFDTVFDAAANRLDVNVDVVDVADILLPGSLGILGFEFNISFNALILAGDPLLDVVVSPGDFLDVTQSFIAALGDPLSGALTVVGALLGAGPGATVDGRLATISFFNVTPGIDPAVLISSVLLAHLGAPTEEFPEGELTAVEVLPPASTSVPEPSSLALVAIGLLALRQRRRTPTRAGAR